MKAAPAPPMRVVPARRAGGRDARGDRPDPAAPAEWVLHRSAIHREAVEALRSGLHGELEVLDTRGIMCGHSLCGVIGQASDPLTGLPLVCVMPLATNMSAVLRWAVLNLSAPNAVLLANRSLHSVPDFDASHFVPVEVRWRHRPVEGITEDGPRPPCVPRALRSSWACPTPKRRLTISALPRAPRTWLAARYLPPQDEVLEDLTVPLTERVACGPVTGVQPAQEALRPAQPGRAGATLRRSGMLATRALALLHLLLLSPPGAP